MKDAEILNFRELSKGDPTLNALWDDLVTAALSLYPLEVERGALIQSSGEEHVIVTPELEKARELFRSAFTMLQSESAKSAIEMPPIDMIDVCEFTRS